MSARAVVLLALLSASACDGGRRVSSGTPSGSRPDGAVGATTDGGNTNPRDGGGPTDRGVVDAGPCTQGPVQPLSQPCCIGLGPDACVLGAFCAALDGRAVPVCYAERSRRDGESCTDDVQCTSGTCGSGRCGTTSSLDLRTPSALHTFFDGAELVEESRNLPSHPHGIADNVNYGSATQCYQSIRLDIVGRTVENHMVLGTLTGAPATGSTGTCDHATAQSELRFSSTAFVISNVQGNGECFDLEVTYAGFGVQGRGAISPDGNTARLEIYFKDQATGISCADGPVGTQARTVGGMPFSGDAVQVFDVRR